MCIGTCEAQIFDFSCGFTTAEKTRITERTNILKEIHNNTNYLYTYAFGGSYDPDPGGYNMRIGRTAADGTFSNDYFTGLIFNTHLAFEDGSIEFLGYSWDTYLNAIKQAINDSESDGAFEAFENAPKVSISIIGSGNVTSNLENLNPTIYSLQASPTIGWRFNGWSGIDINSSANPITFTLTESTTVYANFEELVPDEMLRITDLYPYTYYYPNHILYEINTNIELIGYEALKINGNWGMTHYSSSSTRLEFDTRLTINSFLELDTFYDFEYLPHQSPMNDTAWAPVNNIITVANTFEAEDGDEYLFYTSWSSHERYMFTGTVTVAGDYIILNNIDARINTSWMQFWLIK